MKKDEKIETKNIASEKAPKTPIIDEKRREILSKLGKSSLVIPATIATLSMKANACSMTC